MVKSRSVIIGAPMIAGVGTVVALKYCPVPYAFIALSWLIVAIVGAGLSDREWLKLLCINVFGLLLVLGLLEVTLFLLSDPLPDIELLVDNNQASFGEPHPLLGYAPRADESLVERKYIRGKMIYNATYNFGHDGLRITE